MLQLVNAPISAFAFNKDRSQLALCPNNNELHIYEKRSSDWQLVHTLLGHDKLITSLDWAPQTNRIVSCSQDRNAYVWNLDSQSNEWRPTLVLLRLNRAATFVRWSPLENKFAVASGSKLVSVCYFEQDHDWWVSKHLKKPIRSTVLALDWHPNNVLLATGSADMKCRVFSAYIKGIDEKPAPSPWGERLPFNTLCAEYSVGQSGSWVHSVSFSPDGNSLAWSGHDSTVSIAQPANNNSVKTVYTSFLPFLDLTWITGKSLVAVGFDCQPVLFSQAQDGGDWKFVERLDQAVQKKSLFGSNSAMNKFKQLDSRGQSEDTSSELGSTHQNTITSIRPFSTKSTDVDKFATSGLDGRIVIWDVKTIESQLAGLKIV